MAGGFHSRLAVREADSLLPGAPARKATQLMAHEANEATSPTPPARRRPWRRAALGTLTLTVAVVGWYSVKGWMRMRAMGPETVLPDFVEPSAGPRTPSVTAFGQFEIGKQGLAEVQALAAARGLDCPDTSIRAMMDEMRDAKRKEIEEKGVDAVSGASILKRRSKREQNPQVRLACRETPGATLGREGATPGQLLLVFDSPEYPLRHTSFRRSHDEREPALRDALATVAAYEARFGPPTAVKRPLPDDPDQLGSLQPAEYRWAYADLEVRVTLLDFGKRVSVEERVEVPWPVSADAPTLGVEAGADARPDTIARR